MDLDEVAHHEPPHQDLSCLQIQLFSSLVVKAVRLFSGKFKLSVFAYSLGIVRPLSLCER